MAVQPTAPVVEPAAARFHRTCPGVCLTRPTVPFTEGVRLLEDGESDLHFGGVDGGRRLPAFLRREPLLKITAGIVARRDHPLQRARPTPDDLVRSPWLDWHDGYAAARTGADERGASLSAVLARLRERTGERAGPVLRADAAAGRRRGGHARQRSTRRNRVRRRCTPTPLTVSYMSTPWCGEVRRLPSSNCRTLHIGASGHCEVE